MTYRKTTKTNVNFIRNITGASSDARRAQESPNEVHDAFRRSSGSEIESIVRFVERTDIVTVDYLQCYIQDVRRCSAAEPPGGLVPRLSSREREGQQIQSAWPGAALSLAFLLRFQFVSHYRSNFTLHECPRDRRVRQGAFLSAGTVHLQSIDEYESLLHF